MNFQIEQPQRSRGSGSCIMWLLLLGVVVVVLPLACCGGGAYFVFSAMTDHLKVAATEMEQDPAIREQLGTPIEYDELRIQNYRNNNGEGSAEIDQSFSGPNGTAQVKGMMDLRNNEWSVNYLDVTLPDGSKVTLGNRPNEAEGEAAEAEQGEEGTD